MQSEFLFWSVALFSAIFVGLGKGGLPVVASLAVPSLSLVMSPIAAAGLLLPVYVVSDIFALFAYRRDYEPKVLKIGIIGMTVGVLIGWATAHLVIEWVVTILIGLMGAIFSVHQILKKRDQTEQNKLISHKKGYFWSTVAGFTSFISHNGGPPWQIFVLPIGLSKSVFVGTSVIAFSYVNAIKLIPYYFLGQLSLDNLKIALYLMVPASIAVYVGFR
ncbi:MAG: sulfite exporter TauE/SafE family protein, partial [Proteobacteria bacterium]|nr:sulfite exporter TauE/SafE family protein [Pseudomonadota bacterium]